MTIQVMNIFLPNQIDCIQ